jgi:hypothetical protein
MVYSVLEGEGGKVKSRMIIEQENAVIVADLTGGMVPPSGSALTPMKDLVIEKTKGSFTRLEFFKIMILAGFCGSGPAFLIMETMKKKKKLFCGVHLSPIILNYIYKYITPSFHNPLGIDLDLLTNPFSF